MEGDPIVGGAMAIEGSEIIDIGKESDLLARYPGAQREDYINHVLMPGLINAHTHLDMSHHKNYPFDPVRTLGADTPFVDWLISSIDYKKRTSPERMREAVEEGLDACIESGTTCVGDMGSFEGIFHSLEQKGVRAVIFPEVLSYDSAVAKDLYEMAMAIVDKYSDFDSDLVSVGVAPYSPYTVSRNILKIMAKYVQGANIPLMMHVAESFSEMEFFYNSTGDIATKLFPVIGWGEDLPPAFRKTPVEYLDEVGFLAASPILACCVQMTPGDIDRLVKNKVKMVWCPRSNYYLKQGLAPLKQLKAKNVLLSLGTDGLASTNTLSLWDELRFAMEVSGGQGGRFSAEELLKMVTIQAARVLNLEAEVGSLSVGKKADYILVDASTCPENENIFSHLIQNTKSYHIHQVVVNGEVLKTVN